MNVSMIEAQNVTKHYHSGRGQIIQVLGGITFTMQAGEFVGIMGPSGSGKTTLLNVIATLDAPSTGAIRIAGTDITTLNARQSADFRARRLGFIFQDYNLLDNLTIDDNIALPLALQHAPAAEVKARVARLMTEFGIASLAGRYPVELSGGQKQRAAAARAVIHKPALLLGDEPTGALDSHNAAVLLEILTHLNREGASILMVTHDAVTASSCNRILYMRDGMLSRELRRTGTRQQFYREILALLGEQDMNVGTAAALREAHP
ncbi:ABC transporter ATP-binding protein [Paenibacillus sp. IB182496]|uniref:ABC transporter ATP-binding protein n=1 Tax=Paenibacillus sabuli TaxID=2772509 RepID=A0A927BVQ7_9BACL|nr:ABC transporter ATP-binding protein [Paenibacillus sabuli]MBD2847723.1 ABC transporter ATP-binding protein [Paenibacillus sabuli]